jgi:protein involved in polysaccharide export with SLBB domain
MAGSQMVTLQSRSASAGERRQVRLLAAAGVLVAAMMPAQVIAEDYVLGVQDKVKVKVFEWRASRDAIFEWQALNDTFTVGPGGVLSLPLAGDFDVSGHTTKEVAAAISDSLMRNMDLGRRPNATVQIVQFRPFYIVGAVTQSGEFAYRPGLTVLQAVGIAGGFRSRTDSLDRIEREAIASRGELNLFDLTRINLQARRARLETELAAAAEIKFPSELEAHGSERTVSLILEQEQFIFKARAEGLESQISALRSLKEYLVKELSSLGAQLGIIDRQIGLLQKELKAVASLVSKGFSEAPRQLGLERALAQLQGERVTAETALLRANQEISKTEISIVALQEDRRREVTASLRETQAELDGLARKAETTQQLLDQSESMAADVIADGDQSGEMRPVFKILRPSGDKLVELAAEEGTAVKPGDTIKVEMPKRERSSAAFSAAASDQWRTAAADGGKAGVQSPRSSTPLASPDAQN